MERSVLVFGDTTGSAQVVATEGVEFTDSDGKIMEKNLAQDLVRQRVKWVGERKVCSLCDIEKVSKYLWRRLTGRNFCEIDAPTCSISWPPRACLRQDSGLRDGNNGRMGGSQPVSEHVRVRIRSVRIRFSFLLLLHIRAPLSDDGVASEVDVAVFYLSYDTSDVFELGLLVPSNIHNLSMYIQMFVYSTEYDSLNSGRLLS